MPLDFEGHTVFAIDPLQRPAPPTLCRAGFGIAVLDFGTTARALFRCARWISVELISNSLMSLRRKASDSAVARAGALWGHRSPLRGRVRFARSLIGGYNHLEACGIDGDLASGYRV